MTVVPIRDAFPESRRAADALAMAYTRAEFAEIARAQAEADAEALRKNAAEMRAIRSSGERLSLR